MPATLIDFEFLLQIGQELKGFDGAELIEVQIADAVGELVIDRLEKRICMGADWGASSSVTAADS